MTYQPSRRVGPYVIGIINTAVTVTATEQDIALDDYYTSYGALSAAPTVSGIAFSDMSTGLYQGLAPYSQQCPKAGGGFGSDLPRTLGSRTCGGSLGCAIYSNDTPILRRKSYDSDEVLIDCHVLVLGGP